MEYQECQNEESLQSWTTFFQQEDTLVISQLTEAEVLQLKNWRTIRLKGNMFTALVIFR